MQDGNGNFVDLLNLDPLAMAHPALASAAFLRLHLVRSDAAGFLQQGALVGETVPQVGKPARARSNHPATLRNALVAGVLGGDLAIVQSGPRRPALRPVRKR